MESPVSQWIQLSRVVLLAALAYHKTVGAGEMPPVPLKNG
jgi:hypothetical protein